MINEPCRFYAFLHATGGNWRNSVFIECSKCPYGKAEPCGGFLLAHDAEGDPILMSVESFLAASGQPVDKTECLAVLPRERFETLFSLWLAWRTESAQDCALPSLAGQLRCQDTR